MNAVSSQTGRVSGSYSLKVAAGLWAALALAEIISMWGAAESIVIKWSTTGTFNHAFFIIPISAWLIYERRELLTPAQPSLSPWGLAAMAGAALVWFVGWLSDVIMFEQFGLVLMLQASALALLGWDVVRRLLFPIAYLIFCVPFGEELVPILQQYTAWFAVEAIKLSGIPVYSDGIFISIPKGDFEVAETCSGIRFLIASLAFSSFFANIAFHSWKRRLAIMVLAVVVPIIANGFRAYGIVIIAHLSDMKYAVGADHIVFGWVFFSIVMLILIGIGMTFSDKGVGEQPALSDRRIFLNARIKGKWNRPMLIAAIAAVISVAGPLYAARLASGDNDAASITLAEIGPVPGWQYAESAPMHWQPYFVGTDGESFAVAQRNGHYVSIYVGFYAQQGPGRELIAYNNKIASPPPWAIASQRHRTVDFGAGPEDVILARALAGPVSRTIYYVYWIDGRFTANRYEAKLLSALQKLRGGGRGAAIVAISVVGHQQDNGEAELRDFLTAAGSFSGLIADVIPGAGRDDPARGQ